MPYRSRRRPFVRSWWSISTDWSRRARLRRADCASRPSSVWLGWLWCRLSPIRPIIVRSQRRTQQMKIVAEKEKQLRREGNRINNDRLFFFGRRQIQSSLYYIPQHTSGLRDCYRLDWIQQQIKTNSAELLSSFARDGHWPKSICHGKQTHGKGTQTPLQSNNGEAQHNSNTWRQSISCLAPSFPHLEDL